MRAPEACPPVAPAVIGGGGGSGAGGPELDSVGGDRLPGTVSGCMEGEYSPQSVASADSDKKSSNKRKRDVTGKPASWDQGVPPGVCWFKSIGEQEKQ